METNSTETLMCGKQETLEEGYSRQTVCPLLHRPISFQSVGECLKDRGVSFPLTAPVSFLSDWIPSVLCQNQIHGTSEADTHSTAVRAQLRPVKMSEFVPLVLGNPLSACTRSSVRLAQTSTSEPSMTTFVAQATRKFEKCRRKAVSVTMTEHEICNWQCSWRPRSTEQARSILTAVLSMSFDSVVIRENVTDGSVGTAVTCGLGCQSLIPGTARLPLRRTVQIGSGNHAFM
jgi:hypothetical protein